MLWHHYSGLLCVLDKQHWWKMLCTKDTLSNQDEWSICYWLTWKHSLHATLAIWQSIHQSVVQCKIISIKWWNNTALVITKSLSMQPKIGVGAKALTKHRCVGAHHPCITFSVPHKHSRGICHERILAGQMPIFWNTQGKPQAACIESPTLQCTQESHTCIHWTRNRCA